MDNKIQLLVHLVTLLIVTLLIPNTVCGATKQFMIDHLRSGGASSRNSISDAANSSTQTPAQSRIFFPPYKFPFWGLPYGLHSRGGLFNPGLFPFVPGGPGFPPFDGIFGSPFGPGEFPGGGPTPFQGPGKGTADYKAEAKKSKRKKKYYKKRCKKACRTTTEYPTTTEEITTKVYNPPPTPPPPPPPPMRSYKRPYPHYNSRRPAPPTPRRSPYTYPYTQPHPPPYQQQPPVTVQNFYSYPSSYNYQQPPPPQPYHHPYPPPMYPNQYQPYSPSHPQPPPMYPQPYYAMPPSPYGYYPPPLPPPMSTTEATTTAAPSYSTESTTSTPYSTTPQPLSTTPLEIPYTTTTTVAPPVYSTTTPYPTTTSPPTYTTTTQSPPTTTTTQYPYTRPTPPTYLTTTPQLQYMYHYPSETVQQNYYLTPRTLSNYNPHQILTTPRYQFQVRDYPSNVFSQSERVEPLSHPETVKISFNSLPNPRPAVPQPYNQQWSPSVSLTAFDYNKPVPVEQPQLPEIPQQTYNQQPLQRQQLRTPAKSYTPQSTNTRNYQPAQYREPYNFQHNTAAEVQSYNSNKRSKPAVPLTYYNQQHTDSYSSQFMPIEASSSASPSDENPILPGIAEEGVSDDNKDQYFLTYSEPILELNEPHPVYFVESATIPKPDVVVVTTPSTTTTSTTLPSTTSAAEVTGISLYNAHASSLYPAKYQLNRYASPGVLSTTSYTTTVEPYPEMSRFKRRPTPSTVTEPTTMRIRPVYTANLQGLTQRIRSRPPVTRVRGQEARHTNIPSKPLHSASIAFPSADDELKIQENYAEVNYKS